MNSTKLCTTTSTLIAALTLSTMAGAQGQIPPIPNPGHTNPAGPPTTKPFNTFVVRSAGSGSAYRSSGTATTTTATGVSCSQVTPGACGGTPSVSAGTSFSAFGVTVEFGADWSGGEQKACEICAIFMCMNSTTTTTVRTGESWYENGLGQAGPKHKFTETSSITVPDPSSATLKVECNDSKEAKDFCCPEGKDEDEEGGEDGGEFSLLPGDLTIVPDQFGFGTGMPAPSAFDLYELGAILNVDLRTVPLNPGGVWEAGAPAPHEWWYVAHTVQDLSLAQRYQIAELALESLEQTGFTGRLVVAATVDGGASVTVDLGTLDDILALDSLRLSQPADIDMNGVVDEDDLDIALLDWIEPSSYARGDVDLDGDVTQSDLDLIVAAMDD